MTRIELDDGKYTVVHDSGAGLHALRYGEHWRDMTGDGLVLAMAQEIEDLRRRIVPVQQVSVPTHEMIMAGEDQWERSGNESPDVAAIFLAMLAAAPAAQAADAGASLIEWTKDAVEWGGALNYAAWEFVNECPEKSALLFNNTKGPLRAAIMKYAEIVAAHSAKGVV